jgi:hypothetical protein
MPTGQPPGRRRYNKKAAIVDRYFYYFQARKNRTLAAFYADESRNKDRSQGHCSKKRSAPRTAGSGEKSPRTLLF